ncbi:hypothetical protein COW36_05915 [bacterium (Candidatus Blackallbacteria) CG17_big_fil_post_rev_8_21_14_2_50_48_46]|uniref:NFACT RNA-binding domain-containing protein n=1 Tax=bacterium (Candidatus Blackallbacteria) CG17_big_fil_post_rev_8_21_14_2_50_48_46 TaxID=2014261 RepID=A0A2M7G8A5_9BACT|nr:MAG: hypothetical protein COW64_21510 [bacterium (Candidatus Blackallbacteria) CG18_big_fil_WC_8_21_14_2_50_49_26]PIW18302.1 MAG: hypothetical protein COW36_05915 [bacterium (Candidatus Blackallbacteria) CG17_big_fil_post_rev_8_21_14_2_50_48_46]PIW49526.1 MAG: hypothetical protein COW20_05730 [bacterium (Candidatus Blackallbacteria) CG13_big_fil_rev_8_21_14_2_50_49_14]
MTATLAELEQLCNEFQNLLCAKKIRKIRAHVAGISLETPDPRFWIWEQWENQVACFLSSEKPAAIPPTAFVMLLRKYLNGARIISIQILNQDRILEFKIEQGSQTYFLIAEMSGRYRNLILLNAQQRVLGSLRQDSSRQSPLRTGQPYGPPSPYQGKRTPLSQAFQRLELQGETSAWIQAHWEKTKTEKALNTLKNEIASGLEQQKNAVHRKIRTAELGLEESQSWPEWKKRAELLQGAWGKVKPGASQVKLPDYFDPELKEIEIELDPALDLQANLSRCFKQARRLKRRQAFLENELLKHWEKEATLQALLKDWQNCLLVSESLTPSEQLQAYQGFKEKHQTWFFKLPPPLAKAKSAQGRSLWRSFFSSKQTLIRVGKTDKGNEALLKQGKGNDIWLHTRNWPGAHVLISKPKDQSLDSEDLLDGAALALFYSSQPEESPAEISWTELKYLRRIKASKAGEVLISKQNTLIYRIQPERLKRLKNPD